MRRIKSTKKYSNNSGSFVRKEEIYKYYIVNKLSVAQIARIKNCSQSKINYWLNKYKISKRSISEAVYIKKNPKGNPFKYIPPIKNSEFLLFGLGLGLYWGEGNKQNKNTVRIGNTDYRLLETFLIFLEIIFGVTRDKVKFHLQIFSDLDPMEAKNYWMDVLSLQSSQFYQTTVTDSGKLGTYRNKSKYGVLTIYFGNVKLRNLLVSAISNYKHHRIDHMKYLYDLVEYDKNV